MNQEIETSDIDLNGKNVYIFIAFSAELTIFVPDMDKKLIVRIENKFAQKAPYKLHTRSHVLLYYFLSQIDAFSDQVDDVVIPIKDIETQFKDFANSNAPSEKPTHWGNFKKEVETSILELKSCTTLLPSENKVQKDGITVNDPVSIFQDIKSVYDHSGRAAYKFKIDPRMKGFLYNLAQEYYLQFQLREDVKLSNKHSWRLYVALKSRANSQRKYTQFPYYELTLVQLRELLKLDDDKYTKSYDFKRYVVENALEDINKNSDIRCWEEYLTKGRTLTGVRFHISLSKYNRNQLNLSLMDKKDNSYKILKKISKQNYRKLNLKEFVAHFPSVYKNIVQEVDEKFVEFMDENIKGKPKFDKAILDSWKDGQVRNEIIEFARNELLLFKKSVEVV